MNAAKFYQYGRIKNYFYKLDYSKLGIIPAQICKYLENENSLVFTTC